MKIKLIIEGEKMEFTNIEAYEYEEINVKKNKKELVVYKPKGKNYYQDDIKYLKEYEVIKLLSNIPNPFHNMLFLFMFETAARIGEAMQVKLIDIDFYNKTVKLKTLKRRNKNIVRVLTLSESLLNMILMREKELGLSNSDYLFCKKPGGKSITAQAANKLCKKYFVSILGEEYEELAHPHTLRHSRAIQLLNSGVPITQVKTILGHANIMNTLVYLKYADKDIQESIRKSNEKLGLR